MSIIRRALEQRSVPFRTEYPLQVTAPDVQGSTGWTQGMVWRGSGSPYSSGTDDAMRLSAVFACLRLLSEAVSTLPLDTFYRKGGIRLPYRPRPVYLDFQPPQQSRIDYLSQIMLSLLTDGNAYILTPRDAMGVPLDLIVLDPTAMSVTREAGRLHYRIQDVELDPAMDVMHIKGMMLPGHITGVSPIAYARESISLGLSAQRYGNDVFTNNAVPSGVIETAGKMSAEAVQRWQESWYANHGGQGNGQKVGVLTEGAHFNKISIQPDEAQFLQTRQFQVPDIARIFGVPPHLIADASNSTSWGSGLAEQNLAFGQFSLRPWLERIEDAHGRLLTSHGLITTFVKLNLDSLLRASLMDRYEAGKIAVEFGGLTINEWRALEDMAPVPWGDEPWVPKKISETGPAPSSELQPGATP